MKQEKQKEPKKRANRYEEKISLNIGFEETIKLALNYNPNKKKNDNIEGEANPK